MGLQRLRHSIRRSPLGPLALAIYRWFLTPERRAVNEKGARYDRDASAVMRRILRPDSSCLDVGAHAGSFLEEVLERAPRGTHHAFEPLPRYAAELRRRFPGVHVHEAAVGDEPGETEFVHVANAPAYSGLRERTYDRPDPRLERLRVRIVRIDDVVPAIQPIALIKLDIEGGEFHALRGARRTIERSRPVIVFEAGAKSTGRYGVAPDDVWRLLVVDLACHVSTMARWLAADPPYDEAGFRQAWQQELEFYFIAYPAARAATRSASSTTTAVASPT